MFSNLKQGEIDNYLLGLKTENLEPVVKNDNLVLLSQSKYQISVVKQQQYFDILDSFLQLHENISPDESQVWNYPICWEKLFAQNENLRTLYLQLQSQQSLLELVSYLKKTQITGLFVQQNSSKSNEFYRQFVTHLCLIENLEELGLDIDNFQSKSNILFSNLPRIFHLKKLYLNLNLTKLKKSLFLLTESLSKCQNLDYLVLNFMNDFDLDPQEFSIGKLKTLKSMKTFKIQFFRYNNQIIKELAETIQNFKNLEELEIDSMMSQTDSQSLFTSLSNTQNLKILQLKIQALNEKIAQGLGELISLEVLEIQNLTLYSRKKERKLYLLSQAVELLVNLKSVNIQVWSIKSGSSHKSVTLYEALLKAKKILNLKLEFDDKTIRKVMVLALQNLLLKNQNLINFDFTLNQNWFCQNFRNHFFNGVSKLQELKYLKLNLFSEKMDDASEVGNAIKDLKNLKQLTLILTFSIKEHQFLNTFIASFSYLTNLEDLNLVLFLYIDISFQKNTTIMPLLSGQEMKHFKKLKLTLDTYNLKCPYFEWIFLQSFINNTNLSSFTFQGQVSLELILSFIKTHNSLKFMCLKLPKLVYSQSLQFFNQSIEELKIDIQFQSYYLFQELLSLFNLYKLKQLRALNMKILKSEDLTYSGKLSDQCVRIQSLRYLNLDLSQTNKELLKFASTILLFKNLEKLKLVVEVKNSSKQLVNFNVKKFLTIINKNDSLSLLELDLKINQIKSACLVDMSNLPYLKYDLLYEWNEQAFGEQKRIQKIKKSIFLLHNSDCRGTTMNFSISNFHSRLQRQKILI